MCSLVVETLDFICIKQTIQNKIKQIMHHSDQHLHGALVSWVLFLNFFVADFVLYFYFSCILRQGVTLRLKLLTQPPE